MKLRHIGIALALMLVFGMAVAKDTTKPEPIPAEEYEVYAVAVEHMVDCTSCVVIDTTTIHGDVKDLDHALNFEIQFEKLVTPDLVKDFTAKNKKRYPIAKQFPEKFSVTLLSEAEEHDIFWRSKKDGWTAFRDKYLTSSGITRLSRVGFNKSHDVAAVYVGNVRDWEAGHGAYVLLQKVDGKWKVISETRGWIA